MQLYAVKEVTIPFMKVIEFNVLLFIFQEKGQTSYEIYHLVNWLRLIADGLANRNQVLQMMLWLEFCKSPKKWNENYWKLIDLAPMWPSLPIHSDTLKIEGNIFCTIKSYDIFKKIFCLTLWHFWKRASFASSAPSREYVGLWRSGALWQVFFNHN